MKRINFLSDNQDFEDLSKGWKSNLLQESFLLLGQRLILIIFTAVVFGFAFFNITQVAFSENANSTFVKQENDWFLGDVSFAVVRDLEADSFNAGFVAIPTPTPTPVPVIKISSDNDDVWEKLAYCESRKNWSTNTGNGYYGGLQFSLSAWAGTGGIGLPSEASAEEQIMRGKILQERRGWSPWRTCARKLGLL